jgi:hypothetical protein
MVAHDAVRGESAEVDTEIELKEGQEFVPDVRGGERVFAVFAGDGVPDVVTAFSIFDFEARQTGHIRPNFLDNMYNSVTPVNCHLILSMIPFHSVRV